jgi:predicted nuclease of predicted toxin-antitoxin system
VILWLDAHLPPALAKWLNESFDLQASTLSKLGLATMEDGALFFAAREAGAVILTKDRDLVDLVVRHGPPPQIMWITCGNTTNQALLASFRRQFWYCQELIRSGEPLVEIR